MSLQYHLVKRKLTLGPEQGQEKLFGQVRVGKVIPIDRICRQVSRYSTASSGDVKLVIEETLKVLVDILEDGNVAQMGDLGNFRLSAGCKGAETEEDFSTHLFKKPRVIFTPGKMIKNMLPDVQFSRLPVITVPEECDKEHAM